MPSPLSSDSTKRAEQVRHPATTDDSFKTAYQSKKEKEGIETKITENQSKKAKKQNNKRRQRNSTFELVASVGDDSSVVWLYSLVGQVVCYPVCHLLPTSVYRSFLSTPLVSPPLRIPLVGYSATSPFFVPSPFSWAPFKADGRR